MGGVGGALVGVGANALKNRNMAHVAQRQVNGLTLVRPPVLSFHAPFAGGLLGGQMGDSAIDQGSSGILREIKETQQE